MDTVYISQIPGLIRQLIDIFLPNTSVQNPCAHYLRILSINSAKKYSKSEAANLLKMQKNLSLDQSTRLVQLCKMLGNLNTLACPEEILFLLSELKPMEDIIISSKNLEKIGEDRLENEGTHHVIGLSRDLLFAIQGINSRNFTYSEQFNEFVVNSALTHPIYTISLNLCELGWLYKKITSFINKHINSLSSVTMQSLAYAIKKEINEFYKFTAMLDQLTDKNNGCIKNIWNSCQDAIERMTWLAVLCDAVNGLKGGEILSAIYSYWQTGNEMVKTLMRSILDEVSLPIMQMIKNWMLEGELFDAFHEFFIIPNYAGDREKMWFEMFRLNEEMVPCFFSSSLVNTILLTGKSLHYMRKECAEEEWSECIPTLESVLDLEKAKWVAWISQSTNEKLLNLLFGKYRLQEHCISIKKYLLMAQGDFHQALIEGMQSILNLPAVRIYKHTLVSILENAIKSSNCQYHHPEFTNRLKVVLEDTTGKDKGWDIFTLDYSIDAPLSTFFTSESLEMYRKIFKFLWKVKQAHFFMNSFYQNRNLIQLEILVDIQPQLKRTFLVGHQISHFINILSNYLMVESIEAPWESYYMKLTNAKDLDELIQTHQKFIKKVLENCFLSDAAIHKQLVKILDIIIKFHNSREIFLSSVSEEFKSRSSFCSEILKGDGGCLISKESFVDISEVANVFVGEVLKFNELLSIDDNLKLKKLAFTLDFNEYYSYEALRERGYLDENEEIQRNYSVFRQDSPRKRW